MTLLDEGPVDLTGPSFEWDLEVLEHFGVEVAEAQEALLVDRSGVSPVYGQSGYAMTPWPLPDPRTGAPLVVRNAETDQYEHVVVPAVVEFDPVSWVEIDAEEATRYPSLAGRLWVTSLFGRELGDQVLLDHRPFRVWDLWPLDEQSVVDVQWVALHQACSRPYEVLVAYLRVMAGMDDHCELALAAGQELALHQHRPFGQVDFECTTAQETADRVSAELFDAPDPDGVPWSWTPDVSRLTWPLTDYWAQLESSSRRNWSRALGAAGRDPEVVATERKYCPWLLP